MSHDRVDWLIQQDVSTVREWLRRSWSGVQAVPEDFSWNHVAAALEVLAKSGQGPNYGKPDLEWAKVTISVYDYLLRQADPVSRIMLQDRLMELKGYCMVHLGPVADDPILDVGQLVTWFFQHRSFSLQEAKEMCEFPQKVDIHTPLCIHLHFICIHTLLPSHTHIRFSLSHSHRIPTANGAVSARCLLPSRCALVEYDQSLQGKSILIYTCKKAMVSPGNRGPKYAFSCVSLLDSSLKCKKTIIYSHCLQPPPGAAR